VGGAAAEAMAGMEHATLVAEAASLVAANVRLERERRALTERLERAEASLSTAAAAATAAADKVGRSLLKQALDRR